MSAPVILSLGCIAVPPWWIEMNGCRHSRHIQSFVTNKGAQCAHSFVSHKFRSSLSAVALPNLAQNRIRNNPVALAAARARTVFSGWPHSLTLTGSRRRDGARQTMNKAAARRS